MDQSRKQTWLETAETHLSSIFSYRETVVRVVLLDLLDPLVLLVPLELSAPLERLVTVERP